MIKLFKRYLPSVIFAYFISLGFLYFMQDYLIFPGAYFLKEDVKRNDILKKDIQHLSFTTNDGTKLDGAFMNNNSDTLVIYFGGNAENVNSFMNTISGLKRFDLISFNYRGYGKSEGTPSQQNIYADAIDIFDNFKSKHKKISIIGRSLGTATATYVAANKRIDNLILISPFDSVTNIAQNIYVVFPIKVFIKHPFDSQKYMTKVTAPVSILMMKDDKIVPNINTLNLKKNIKNLKLFQELEDSNHNKITNRKKLIDFISAALK